MATTRGEDLAVCWVSEVDGENYLCESSAHCCHAQSWGDQYGFCLTYKDGCCADLCDDGIDCEEKACTDPDYPICATYRFTGSERTFCAASSLAAEFYSRPLWLHLIFLGLMLIGLLGLSWVAIRVIGDWVPYDEELDQEYVHSTTPHPRPITQEDLYAKQTPKVAPGSPYDDATGAIPDSHVTECTKKKGRRGKNKSMDSRHAGSPLGQTVTCRQPHGTPARSNAKLEPSPTTCKNAVKSPTPPKDSAVAVSPVQDDVDAVAPQVARGTPGNAITQWLTGYRSFT